MNTIATSLGLLEDINVRVSVELGSVNLALREVLGFAPDSIVALDRLTDEPLDVLVNGKPVARAEVVAQGGRFALRIIELVAQRQGGEQAGPAGQAVDFAHPAEQKGGA